MSAPLIKPRTLKGFRDFLPEAMLPRESLIATARQVYQSYGFSPIDTPALELLEILEGKGGEESNKQLYKFRDPGGREVALRFDLTVPLARFVAEHASALGTPFKRYHIGTVWRGENPQLGRYREFIQCDFDTVGTRGVAADIETALVIHDLLEALGFRAFTIQLNSRLVLSGLLEKLGIASATSGVLRALDKLSKIGAVRVRDELVATAGLNDGQAQEILKLSTLVGTNDAILDQLARLVDGSAAGEEGTARLAAVVGGIAAAGVPPQRVRLNVSLARGLDYYTGLVYETLLDDLPDIGSVCSGGRYDNLAGLFTRQELPGVGASLGLDRLLAAMEKLDMIPRSRTAADVFIPYFDSKRLGDYLRMASALRRAGFAVEVYPDSKKLGQQLKYANHRGFAVALIAGETEFDSQTCQLKQLDTGQSRAIPTDAGYEELITVLTQLVARD